MDLGFPPISNPDGHWDELQKLMGNLPDKEDPDEILATPTMPVVRSIAAAAEGALAVPPSLPIASGSSPARHVEVPAEEVSELPQAGLADLEVETTDSDSSDSTEARIVSPAKAAPIKAVAPASAPVVDAASISTKADPIEESTSSVIPSVAPAPFEPSASVDDIASEVMMDPTSAPATDNGQLQMDMESGAVDGI